MDGRALAARIREELKGEIAEFGDVGLATILVGDDPASQIYIRLKHKAAEEVGIQAIDERLPQDTAEGELLELVGELNEDDSIDGLLVQTPLPAQIDEARVMRTLDPMKDVDGLHPFNAGQLYLGSQTLVPATPRAVFMVQKEVAARLAARPGSRDYGYLSVRAQVYADVERLFDVPPSAFQPPPAVDSTVVRLLPRNRAAELGLADPARFLRFAGQCFRQKRKTLRNNLARLYGKDAMDDSPEAGKRAEELTLEQFATLYRRLVPS